MKNALLSIPIVFFLFLNANAVAQNQSNDESWQGAHSDKNSEKLELRTVVGCLSKTGKTYVILGGAPGPKQFRIVGGDTSALKGKIGQTVKVVGLVGKNDPYENILTPTNEGTTTGAGYNTIVAQKIKIVYGNCSESGKEYAGDHM